MEENNLSLKNLKISHILVKENLLQNFAVGFFFNIHVLKTFVKNNFHSHNLFLHKIHQ